MKNKFFLALVILSMVYGGVAQQLDTPINAIQGDNNQSPKAGQQVATSGIVTAVGKRGFFIQTPDSEIDKSSKTSEGIYVFTNEEPPAEAVVGNLVRVSGTVTEYRPRNERYTLQLTEITRPRVQILEKNKPLPAPIVLTAVDLDPKGSLDQMERFEGMRVKINSLTVIAPTGGRVDEKKGTAFSDGIFYGVLTGTPRPFREPGIEAIRGIFDKMPKELPYFDMNPEILRINSKELKETKGLDVPAGTVIKNLVGVVDYYEKYTILIDGNSPPTVEKLKTATPAQTPKEREVLVSSFNLHNFFDDEVNSSNVEKETVVSKEYFQSRLNKTSLAIRKYMAMPDVLGVIEVENAKALQKLADKINADAVAENQPNPKYEAFLVEGNDRRGIDVGYLIKTSRVKVLETKQLGKDEMFVEPVSKISDSVFDRPPLLLRAEVADAKTGKPFEITVIVNHFKSLIGVDTEKDGERVRMKRLIQAAWLAEFVQERAKTNPSERLILCGDFNAFQFNDGYVDLMSVLVGRKAGNALKTTDKIFKTGLVNLVEVMNQSQRYSYIYDGNAQTLDHVLVNEGALKHALMFGFSRLNADYPIVYGVDSSRPEKVSDHDATMLYLTLDEIKGN